MNNSADVDNAEADYNCPSWIRAFDVRCIFVGGVVRSGQEQEREKVVPNTSQAHCSNTATYLLPPPHPLYNWGNRLSDVWHKLYPVLFKQQRHLCIFSVHPGCVSTLCTSLWSQSTLVAWHHNSPCLLMGLGIYCNAIVVRQDWPCTDTDDAFLIEFGVIIALLEAIHGDGHVWRREWIPSGKNVN